ncbi:hypothetical protein [Pseudomonas protegens]|uniref:hypothetical protein n=1 Tax=Pseudomonas protegens TaxID=380021 RepID=UPI001F3C8E9E|nr:hypothetical protein [Pseudomonas protegens]
MNQYNHGVYLPPKKVMLLLFIFLSTLILLRSHTTISNWNSTQWLFNYSESFVKRGLLGEALRIFVDHIDRNNIAIASYIILSSALALLTIVFYVPVSKSGKAGIWIFFFIALTHPATLQHFIYDPGRFDTFCLALALTSMLFITRFRGPLGALIVLISMSTSILAHEASFLMYVPLVIAYWIYIEPDPKKLPIKLLTLIALLAVTYIVSTQGLLNHENLEKDLLLSREKYGNWVVSDSLDVLYKGGVIQNISRTAHAGASIKYILHSLIAFTFILLPMIFLARKFINSNNKPKLSKPMFLVMLAALSPLALYPLGSDHFRWWSLAITNIFIAISIFLYRDSSLRDYVCIFLHSNKKTCIFLIASSIVLGPLGVTNSLDPCLALSKAAQVSSYFDFDWLTNNISFCAKNTAPN